MPTENINNLTYIPLVKPKVNKNLNPETLPGKLK